jgi:hypothetical protein
MRALYSEPGHWNDVFVRFLFLSIIFLFIPLFFHFSLYFFFFSCSVPAISPLFSPLSRCNHLVPLSLLSSQFCVQHLAGARKQKVHSGKLGSPVSVGWQITKANHYGKQGSLCNLRGNLEGKYGVIPPACTPSRGLLNKKFNRPKTGVNK